MVAEVEAWLDAIEATAAAAAAETAAIEEAHDVVGLSFLWVSVKIDKKEINYERVLNRI